MVGLVVVVVSHGWQGACYRPAVMNPLSLGCIGVVSSESCQLSGWLLGSLVHVAREFNEAQAVASQQPHAPKHTGGK